MGTWCFSAGQDSRKLCTAPRPVRTEERRLRSLLFFGTPVLTIFGYGGLSSVEVFNPSTQSWSPGPSLPVALTEFALSVAGGSLYAAGGWSTTRGPALNTLYSLTP
jgi:hypothetical protein